jgi:RimJ/RimL family protein N-acetyltransferase
MRHWTTRVLGDDTVTKRTILVEEQVVGNIVSFEMSDERLVGLLDRSRPLGEGIATRALSLFVADVDTRRPLHAHVARQNPASIRVLEKAGFEIVGEATIEESGAEI